MVLANFSWVDVDALALPNGFGGTKPDGQTFGCRRFLDLPTFNRFNFGGNRFHFIVSPVSIIEVMV